MKCFLFTFLLAFAYGQQQAWLFAPMTDYAYHFSGDGTISQSYYLNNAEFGIEGHPQKVQRSIQSPFQPEQQRLDLPQSQPAFPQYNSNPNVVRSPYPVEGAVYFMTNDPRGNAIISTSIQAGGLLSYSQSFPTGGLGGYNIPFRKPQGSPDPLASQNSLVVGDDSLFAANAGSNSISMFAINPKNPMELTLLSQVTSGGDFPVAMAYSPLKQMLCALNAGTQNGVQCFSTRGGSLATLPGASVPLGLTSTTPPRELGSVSDIIFTPDASQLLVSVKLNPNPARDGIIAVYQVEGHRITRRNINIPHTNSVTPWGMSIVPGTGIRSDPMVVFTDPLGNGFGISTITKEGTIASSYMIEIPGQMETCWTAFSPRTRSLYTIDSFTNIVTESTVDVRTQSAQILNQYTLTNGTSPIDASIASLGDKDILYVLGGGDQSIKALGLIGPGQTFLLQNYLPSRGNPGLGLNTGVQGLATYLIR